MSWHVQEVSTWHWFTNDFTEKYSRRTRRWALAEAVSWSYELFDYEVEGLFQLVEVNEYMHYKFPRVYTKSTATTTSGSMKTHDMISLWWKYRWQEDRSKGQRSNFHPLKVVIGIVDLLTFPAPSLPSSFGFNLLARGVYYFVSEMG